MNNKVLGIIPARGGSKGLPGKNIRPLHGRPLIAHTIEAALRARLLDHVLVSTDEPQIADVARQWGAEAPFLRPPELAEDETLIYPVLVHATLWLEEQQGYRPDYVMLLQPTSPLRTAEDIDNSIRLALEKDADGVVSLCRAKHHPYWTKSITEEGRIGDFMVLDKPVEQAYGRRQDLPPAYAINGSIYLVKRDILLERQTFYTEHTYPYVMPVERSLDIDTLWDLQIAELALRSESLVKGD